MTDFIRDWFQRKLAGSIAPLAAMGTFCYEYSRIVGPRSIYAKLALSISPHGSFAFESKAQWPEENYDSWVVDGILDALFGWDYRPPLGARFVLEEVGWHPVYSAPIAYYRAAKVIVRSVLLRSEGR